MTEHKTLLRLVFCFTSLLLLVVSQAQIRFEKTYGSTALEEGISIQQTPDQGYIIGGTNLVKLSDSGTLVWSKPYASSYANTTRDSGYILVRENKKLIFTKVSADGEVAWNTVFSGGIWRNEANYIAQTKDSGYIVTGRLQDVTGSGMLLLKLGSKGEVVWRRTYSEGTSAGFNEGFHTQETQDGGYITTGYFHKDYYDTTRHTQIIVLKTNSEGNEEWRRYIGGSHNDAGAAIRQDKGGNYLVLTTINSATTNSQLSIVKLAANGDSLWTKTYGGDYTETARDLQITQDNGYLIVGGTQPTADAELDGYIVKTDEQGNVLWTKTYTGSSSEIINSVQQTADNGYVMTGSTASTGEGNLDLLVLKTDANGNWESTLAVAEQLSPVAPCQLYPNPSSGPITLKSQSLLSRIEILNPLGEVVHVQAVNGLTARIAADNLANGVYYTKIYFQQLHTVQVVKVVLR